MSLIQSPTLYYNGVNHSFPSANAFTPVIGLSCYLHSKSLKNSLIVKQNGTRTHLKSRTKPDQSSAVIQQLEFTDTRMRKEEGSCVAKHGSLRYISLEN